MSHQRQYSPEEAEAILKLAARQSEGLSSTQLAQIASEAGISPEQLAAAEAQFRQQRDEARGLDSRRATQRKEFLSHLYTYLAVNAGLLVMDFVPDGRLSWVFFVLAGWGIGLFSHLASLVLPPSEPTSSLSPTLRPEVDAVLESLGPTIGKIEAIKIVRERFHLGLKEAKDAVDEYEARHPRYHA